MSYLSDSKKIYIDFFPDGWIESLDWSSKVSSNQSFVTGILKINQFISKWFVAVSKSVLCGEYISISDFEVEIDDFERCLEIENNPSVQKRKSELYNAFGGLRTNIYNSLRYYRSLVLLTKNKIKIVDEEGVLFSVFSSKRIEYKNVSDKYFSQFVSYVITVAKADHFFCTEADDTVVSNLILMRNELSLEKEIDDHELKFIYSILYDKCSFLLKKAGRDNFVYSIDFKINCLSNVDMTIDGLSELDRKWNFINQSYNPQYALDINKWEEDQYYEKLNLSHFVLLMKHYQKDHQSLHQATNLMRQFIRFYNKTKKKHSVLNSFDRYSLDTIYNYLHNCKFSICMSMKNYSFDQLKKDLVRTDELQENTHIRNFYPYRKAALFLEKSIENELENENTTPKRIQEMIDLMEEVVIKYEKSITWCSGSKFYPFQLRFSECLITYKDHNDVDFHVFMPSSFNKPIKYADLREELIKLKSLLNSFKAQLSIQKRIQKETRELLSIKDKIDSTEKKYLEILGIFTAVITFLFSSINVFNSNNENGNIFDIVKNTAILGLILLSFCSAVYFLTIKKQTSFKEYFKHPRFLFFLFSWIIYIGLIIILVLR